MDAASAQKLILGILSTESTATSERLQAATGKSQPTVSRLLAGLGPQVLALGTRRGARYGLGKTIHGRPSQHPLYWTDEVGHRSEIGTLSFLANGTVHVQSALLGDSTGPALAWYLSPLRSEGFLGRIAARSMAALGVDADPERWSLETVLYSALQLHDPAGAITVGLHDDSAKPKEAGAATLHAILDESADRVATTLSPGSSAGGKQPKFLAVLPGVGHVIVKFTPPLPTPGGQRWSELLQAECLAASTLAAHGFNVATSHLVVTSRRTYLVSERFDRVGLHGRHHVVPVAKAHEAFLQGGYRNWADSTAALARRGHLRMEEAETTAALRDFGRLIGNTDMHGGNLGLFVDLDGIRKGRFVLAPVYDMLPMRWRPDPLQGGVHGYTPFELDSGALASPVASVAQEFWVRLADGEGASKALREVAGEMARRCA